MIKKEEGIGGLHVCADEWVKACEWTAVLYLYRQMCRFLRVSHSSGTGGEEGSLDKLFSF